MANTFSLISKTVAGGGETSITFSSIPATYKDLILYASSRCNTGATVVSGTYIAMNGLTSAIYSNTTIAQNNTAYTSVSNNGNTACVIDNSCVGSSGTANNFSALSAYIADYAGSTMKTLAIQHGSNGNNTTNYQARVAQIINSTAAINSLTIYSDYAYAANSTFYLYGIKNS